MHASAKRPNSTKIKSAKTFLKAFPRKFIPSKYTRYTVCGVGVMQQHTTVQYEGFVAYMYVAL